MRSSTTQPAAKTQRYGAFALVNNTSGSNNIALGSGAGSCLTTGDNNIDIGNPGVAGEANTIRIGTAGTQTAAYIAGIAGVTVTGNPVVIDESGHLGTVDVSQLSQGPAGPARSSRRNGIQAQRAHKVRQVQLEHMGPVRSTRSSR